jgi:Ca2+/Na+ antiporter
MARWDHVDREKGVLMKRIGFLLATATAFVLCLAVPAFAGSQLGNNPGGPGVSGAGGTAFTGANVSAIFMYLVAFVVVGALALFAGRRRTMATR